MTMPAFSDLAVLVLAAGASRRFGPQDKLLATQSGRPLAAHAFALAGGVPAAQRLAVTASPAVAALAHQAGLRALTVPPGGRQSDSLRAGIAALSPRIGAVLILLADMPCLEPGDLAALLHLCAPACATNGIVAMPPALLPRDWLADLPTATDQGARNLLRRIPQNRRIHLPTGHLHDIDVPSDFG
ncbi:MAG: NTP transferase domain-containing protein [Paracoccus sp. (in: a-proteobacteria)]|uniref:nucleotidyltransferase family protein n=1 Tax=Paracoccus sp. TaxID=267 RepID=UPI0026E0055A|nr:NTP transferase domain-containing protein [Paracoccus sp. (in: a-proteobacteria)]MDO5622989.1 NTP transferase domain-containing protein [Paracoccus sp. (in: a-proteobacteria)]